MLVHISSLKSVWKPPELCLLSYHIFGFLSIVFSSICLFVFLSFHLSVFSSFCLFVFLSFCLYTQRANQQKLSGFADTLHNVLFGQYHFLASEQAKTYLKIYVLIYHSTYICPSLFGWKENLTFKETVTFKL